MNNFHLGRNGEPGPCGASKGRCPLGGPDSHFEDEAAAVVEAESRFTEENGGVFTGAALKRAEGRVNDTESMSSDSDSGETKPKSSTADIGSEFGFSDPGTHPVVDDVDWDAPDAAEQADALEREWAVDHMRGIYERYGMKDSFNSYGGRIPHQQLFNLKKSSARSLDRYRKVRELEGVEPGEYVDGSSSEMDDDYLDAKGDAVDAAVLEKHMDAVYDDLASDLRPGQRELLDSSRKRS